MIEAPISSGTLTIPPLPHTRGPFLASIWQEDQGIFFAPLQPELFISGNPITLPSTSFPVAIGSVTYSIMQLNEQLVTTGQTTPVILYPKDNYLAVYSTTAVKQNIGRQFFQNELHNCATEETRTKDTLFGKDKEIDSITLVGRQSRPCIYSKLSDVVINLPTTASGVVRVGLEYKLKDNAQPIVCLSKEGESSCLFQQLESLLLADGGWSQVSYLVPVRNYPLSNLWLKLELAADSPEEKQISYRNFSLEFLTHPIASTRFNIETNQLPLELPVSAGTLTLRFPKQMLKEILLNPASTGGEKRNCYSLGTGTFDRTVQTDPDGKRYIEYTARDASSCDYFSFTDPLIKAGGITLIETRTKQGRPIKACLKIDPPGYCLVEELLYPAIQGWRKAPLLFPSVQSSQSPQYFIELDNYAVGQEIRTNDIGEIQIIPLPMDWLTSIRIKPNGNIQPQGRALNSELTVSHPNPAFYEVSLNPKLEALSSTLILSQSFDPGWMALQRTDAFPFFMLIKEHILVNNWANGWRLQSDQSDQFTNPTNIVVFFWPQLLELLGFALLPIPFLFAIRKSH